MKKFIALVALVLVSASTLMYAQSHKETYAALTVKHKETQKEPD